MSAPVLSIVIVNWNTRDLLEGCLRSIGNETLVSHEIWVVDNGSSDGSADMVRDEFPGVRLIANAGNRGFAAANNQAFPLCQGEYVLLLNSDTIVLDGALDRMVAFMHPNPHVGALGCKLLNADGTLQPSAHHFYGTWRSLIENRLVQMVWRRRHAHTPFLTFWDHGSVREVDWVCGAVLMVRREVLHRAGGLDEDFFMYGEEIDWQWRMKRANRRVFFMPNAQIVHFGGASSSQAVSHMRRLEYQSRERFVAKHYPPAARALYRTKTALGIAFWQGVGLLRRRRVQVR